ncbi:MAG: sensor histidine kinase [Propionibacteriales bacterium]|nr:sensor histidine kinase [Propionibacteriales bacterium]
MGPLSEPGRFGWMPVFVTVLAVGCLVEVAVRPELAVLGLPTPVAAAALVALVLPLLAWRRFPFAAPVAVWVAADVLSFVAGGLVAASFGAYLTGVVAAFLLGNLRDPRRGRIGLAIVVVSAILVVLGDPRLAVGTLAFLPAFFALAWFVGLTVRSRVAQAEASEQRAVLAELARESEARTAVAEERARIARELHDVVAHSMSVMVLLVGAVRQRMPAEREEDRNALQEVERLGRQALGETRRLVGALARDDEAVQRVPQPSLDDLAPLVEQLRLVGLEVELRVDEVPAALAPALGLSIYRIIQEGLTNVVKHAHATRAEVRVGYRAGEVVVEIRDNGVGETTSDGSGRGLLGIAERVKIYDGQLRTGASPEGGYELTARIPVSAGRQ